ncbi:hypothetical protein CfE428DRAFT_2049 [Chthoniobacter flavus Ellin428]|uniref:Uncharacterized protein n=1 Tax=Chthoniobacter flavus Ellin428 TaxID=497964 RepID=B4CZG1_9BACT|nr:hypothetical protein [Chthoniobacter flavus]EDY20125.1 hypothetical protein CfE428DRAFT_2049 [Chthoniobacter flavus Ellin428]
MKHLLLVLVFTAAALVPLRADVDIPATAKAVGAVDEPTYKLFQIVTGSTWNYLWHHTTVEIAFAEDGTMAKAPWPGAKWRITGPHAVSVTTDKPSPREMVLHFINSQQFSCKDWTGDPASGSRRKSNPPPAK